MSEYTEDPAAYLLPDDKLRILTFVFALPEQLPLPNESTITTHLPPGPILDPRWKVEATIDLGGGLRSEKPMSLEIPLVSLRFWQPRFKEQMDFGEAGIEQVIRTVWPPDTTAQGEASEASREPYELETYRTVIQATTQAAPAEGEREAPNVVAACFNRCLQAVNHVIDSYSVVVGDPMANVSAPQVGMFTFVSSKVLGKAKSDVGPIIYFMPWAPPTTEKPILEPDQWERVSAAVRSGMMKHPFLTGVRFQWLAVRALHRGEYAQAVIFSATSGEILLNNLLRSVLVEGGDVDRAREIFDDVPGLRTRLRSAYHTRLGAGHEWNPDHPGSAINRWWQAMQVVRGRFVHGGVQPTPQQAHDAVEANEALEGFIHRRLIDRRLHYPATLLSAVSVEELERRNVLSKRMRALIEQTDVPAHWRKTADVAVSAGDEPDPSGD